MTALPPALKYTVHNNEPLDRLRRCAPALFLPKVLDADLSYVAVKKIVFTISNHMLQGHETHGKRLGTLCRASVHNAEQEAGAISERVRQVLDMRKVTF